MNFYRSALRKCGSGRAKKDCGEKSSILHPCKCGAGRAKKATAFVKEAVAIPVAKNLRSAVLRQNSRKPAARDDFAAFAPSLTDAGMASLA